MPSSHEPHSGLSIPTSNTQPRLGTHSLLVQMSLSSHITGPPPVQVPATQVEFSVQRFPSSHVVPSCLFVCVHMPTVLHWSAVQTLPSSPQKRGVLGVAVAVPVAVGVRVFVAVRVLVDVGVLVIVGVRVGSGKPGL